MGILTSKRTMQVAGVEVINGCAGEDYLYRAHLRDGTSGRELALMDWGRGLKVPKVGELVDVKLGKTTWENIDEVSARNLVPEISGFGKMKGPKVDTGYVGIFAFRSGDDLPDLNQIVPVPGFTGRMFNRLERFENILGECVNGVFDFVARILRKTGT